MIQMETLITIISLIVAGVSCIGGLYFNTRNSSKADTDRVIEETKKDAKLEVKMEEVVRSNAQLSADVKSLLSEFQKTSERMALNESSIKSLHKRVDYLFDKMGIDRRITDMVPDNKDSLGGVK